MSLVAVDDVFSVPLLHVVATKKGGSDPALLVSEPVLCSPCINPRLSRKTGARARICATYGRSVSAGAWLFSNFFWGQLVGNQYSVLIPSRKSGAPI